MDCGAHFSYLSKSKMQYLKDKAAGAAPRQSAQESEEAAAKEVDANIIRISLGTLEDVASYATGDPFRCTGCGSIFSTISKDRVMKEGVDKFWNCEFCLTKNKLTLDEAEYPTSDSPTYVIGLQKPQVEEAKAQPSSNENMKKEIQEKLAELAKKKEKEPTTPEEKVEMQNIEAQIKDLEKKKVELSLMEQKEEVKQAPVATDDITVIFCIDISGSMNATVNAGSGRTMKYVRDKNSISRLEAVKAAVDSQITKMAKEAPNRKVGFIAFASSVELHGDCSQPLVVLDDKYYNDFYGMVEHSSNYSQTFLSKAVHETAPKLLQRLSEIHTAGSTALGPALVASIALASKGSAGSKVIICTDGLANEGMGSVEGRGSDAEAANKFYTDAGQYAQRNGVVVSVISIVASECRLDLLSPIAGLTGGDVLRVDPANLSSDFSSLLAEKVIATQVVVKVRLHKIMQFSAVPEQYLSADKLVYTQEVGSANRESIVTCSYSMKPVVELEKYTDVDYKNLTELPLQTHVEYKALNGNKCLKVISKKVKCSEDLSEAKKGMDKNIVRSHAIQSTAKYSKHGMYGQAMEQAARIASLPEAKAEQQELEEKVRVMKTAIGATQKYQAKSKSKQQLDELSSAINQALKKS